LNGNGRKFQAKQSDKSCAVRPPLRNRPPFASRTPNSDLRTRFCGAATALPPLSTIPIIRQRAPPISAKWQRRFAQPPGRGTLRPFSDPRESTRRGSFAARQSFSESAICANPQRRDDRISKQHRIEGPPIESPDGFAQSDRRMFRQC
jgi:hypothetical protein